MNFSLIPDESPTESLRRIVEEQIDGAIAQLHREDDLNEAVHEARKRFKRVRAVLRLARGALRAKTYRANNRYFRDQGRLLSPVRDSAVNVETMDLLRRRYGFQMTDEGFVRLRQSLAAENRSALRTYVQDEQGRAEMVASLRRARERAIGWRLDASDFSLFEGGLKRIYRRGRAELRAACEDPTTENFHAWRKRVKYLWHHMQVLRPLWPAQIGALADECDRLADRIGEEHDLAVLMSAPTVKGFVAANGSRANLLASIVSRERDRQRRAAIPLGDRIYAECPVRFVERVEGYWLAYRRGSKTHTRPAEVC